MSFRVCHFVLVFFSPFSIAITSLEEERANRSAFRTFVWFVLVYTERKKKRRVEFFPSYFNHFLRCLL